ncbi:MAG: response regulator [bacterium]
MSPAAQLRSILVVDDNPAIQEFLEEVFTTWGPFNTDPCEVFTASSVEEALQRLQTGRYDLIILDMVLADGNGLQVLDAMRSHDVETPAIVISADDPIDLRRRATEMGAKAFLRKGDGVESLVREAMSLMDTEPSVQQEARDASEDVDEISGRILVVDDDPLVCDALASMMELLDDTEVKTASGGREGLQISREWEPHIILLDIAMPDMDGRQTLQALTEEGLKSRVIMVSAFRDSDIAKECVELGAVDYIPKPVDFPFLKRAVVGHLALAKREMGR